jgi:hypothetical protein
VHAVKAHNPEILLCASIVPAKNGRRFGLGWIVVRVFALVRAKIRN